MSIEEAYTAVVSDLGWRPKGYGRQVILNMRAAAAKGWFPSHKKMATVLKEAGWRITTSEKWAQPMNNKR